MVRTDLDALPVKRRPGLPYASEVTAKDATGDEVGRDARLRPRHAHDSVDGHGARMLARSTGRDGRGTLDARRPARRGAQRRRAGDAQGRAVRRVSRKPGLRACHARERRRCAAGAVGYHAGLRRSPTWTAVDVTVYGRGGHGAHPHSTVDPVVLAARSCSRCRRSSSRENAPFDPAVITVGSIHGGTKHNIIPDEVKLQLTVRSLRARGTAARCSPPSTRIAKAEAAAARAPRAARQRRGGPAAG